MRYVRLFLPLLLLCTNAYALEITHKDFNALVYNCYYEARDQGPQGMRAVTEVVLNRTKDRRYPNSAFEVVYQNRQFSWTSSAKLKEMHEASLFTCEAIVFDVIADARLGTDFTHYYACSGAYEIDTPYWAQGRAVSKINDHCFVRL